MRLREGGKPRILFYCGHPAHFHLIKNTANSLLDNGYYVRIAIKSKDVLEDLVRESGIQYFKISDINTLSRVIKYYDAITRLIRYALYIKRQKFDLLVGTSWENSKIGYFLKIPSICLNEDDADVVPLFAKNAYPKANEIITPISCRLGEFEGKATKIHSFHELAYLHPSSFSCSEDIAKKYIDIKKPFFIIRFANLNAHHDKGISGINLEIAKLMIEKLQSHGRVYITSERFLESDLEQYRISINPKDMHHVMAFASLYIGDSQTMAAEAGVLGVPFIRFNDFVGRISYLDDLENKYQLGYGIKTSNVEMLYKKVDELINMLDRKEVFQERRTKMLSEKIDYANFLTWFIQEYPNSVNIMNDNSDYQFNFK